MRFPTAQDDPIEIFNEWYEAAQSTDSIKFPNAMTLATVDTLGRPHARVVLLKAHDHRGFCFFTNYTSAKSEQIRSNSNAALTFYWQELDKQIRIEGSIEKVSDAESNEYFNSRPRGSRIGAWASKQSQFMENYEELQARVAKADAMYEGQEDIPRPPHWGGWRLVPDYIEFWDDGENRLHKRFAFEMQEDGHWLTGWLYP